MCCDFTFERFHVAVRIEDAALARFERSDDAELRSYAAAIEFYASRLDERWT